MGSPRTPLLGGGPPPPSYQGQASLVLWASAMTLANVLLLFSLFRNSASLALLLPAQLLGAAQPDTAAAAVEEARLAAEVELCTQSAFEVAGANSSWHSMKRVPPPAQCRVQGFVMEKLEPEYNFRRGWTLGHADHPEDRMHLLPYLRPIQDRNMATKKRRVLLAMGAGKWENVLWFLRWYPLDFTEIHVFEEKKGHFKKPPNMHNDRENLLETLNGMSQVDGAGKLPVPDWVLDRVRLYYSFIRTNDSDAAESSIRTVNISKVIHNNLKLTPDDAVVALMDIEHAEWDVLPVWMSDPDMPRIIDELFLEVHYRHSSMEQFQWTTGHTRDEAARLLLQLRFKGFFVHPWP